MTHTIKIRDVPDEYKKLLLALETDLGGNTGHREALEALLDAYDKQPEMVLEATRDDPF